MALIYSAILGLAVAGSASAHAVQARAECPGVNYAAETNGVSTSACCVGGVVPSVFLSVCEGWPICKGPTTTTTTSTPLSCVTLLPFSDANYAADLSSITASMAASGTTYCTTIGVAGNKCNAAQTASSTGSSSSSTTSSTATSTSTSTSTSASTTASASSSDSGNTNANGSGGDASTSGASDSASGDGANVSVSISASSTVVSSEGGSGSSSSSSSTTTTTTTTTKSGSASAFGMGWQSWALGLFGIGPAVLAVLL